MTPKRPPTVADIEWLFTTCESECGIKSNFPAQMIALKQGARRSRVDEDSGDLVNGVVEDLHNEDALIDELDARAARSRLGAARKNRRVMAAFTRLEHVHQRTFAAAYEARQRPPAVRLAFGHLAGVAALTTAARAVRGYSMTWLARAIHRGDPRVARIREEADRMFADAVAALQRARAEAA